MQHALGIATGLRVSVCNDVVTFWVVIVGVLRVDCRFTLCFCQCYASVFLLIKAEGVITKKSRCVLNHTQRLFLILMIGSYLISHLAAVPSALTDLTALFGMGRGEPCGYYHQSNSFSQFYLSVILRYAFFNFCKFGLIF